MALRAARFPGRRCPVLLCGFFFYARVDSMRGATGWPSEDRKKKKAFWFVMHARSKLGHKLDLLANNSTVEAGRLQKDPNVPSCAEEKVHLVSSAAL